MTIEVPLYTQGGTYSAHMDRFMLALNYDEGVIDLSCFKVSQRAAGANFSVDISLGEAIVQGDDETNQGCYAARCTAIENVVIGGAPGSNSRIDLVGLRINDPTAGGNAGNTGTIVVTAGTVAASPVAPATPATTLPLGYIAVASGQASVQNANITDARYVAGIKCMPGTMQFIATTFAPNGWLLCFGQAISRTTYARLFANIGTAYGVGDGSTTFNLPDLRGRIPVALDNMGGTDAGRTTMANTLGGTGGEEQHVLTTGELATHLHSVDPPVFTDFYFGQAMQGGAGPYRGLGPDPTYTSATPNTVDIAAFNSGNAGSNIPHNNMQPYILLNGMIRT